MKRFTVLLLIFVLSLKANAFDIWINERLWSPPGECMIHSESLLAPAMVYCSNSEAEIEIILDSSYKTLEWVKNRVPTLKKEAKNNGKYFVRGKTEYIEINRLNDEPESSYYSRFILGEHIYVRVTSKSLEELNNVSNQVWQ